MPTVNKGKAPEWAGENALRQLHVGHHADLRAIESIHQTHRPIEVEPRKRSGHLRQTSQDLAHTSTRRHVPLAIAKVICLKAIKPRCYINKLVESRHKRFHHSQAALALLITIHYRQT